MFSISSLLGPFFRGPGVRLGRNVRVQRVGCVQAELPSATVTVGDHSIVYERAVVRAYGAARVAIGERSGALEALLEKIAEFYDSQVKAAIKSLTSLIEPLLISFMGVIVGGVVLSVFLPILDVVGKLSGS